MSQFEALLQSAKEWVDLLTKDGERPRSEATADDDDEDGYQPLLDHILNRLEAIEERIRELDGDTAKRLEELADTVESYRQLNNDAHAKLREQITGAGELMDLHLYMRHGEGFVQTMQGDANVDAEVDFAAEQYVKNVEFNDAPPKWDFQPGDTFQWRLSNHGTYNTWGDCVVDHVDDNGMVHLVDGSWDTAEALIRHGRSFKHAEPKPRWDFKPGDFVRLSDHKWVRLDYRSNRFAQLYIWTCRDDKGGTFFYSDATLLEQGLEFHRPTPEGWVV